MEFAMGSLKNGGKMDILKWWQISKMGCMKEAWRNGTKTAPFFCFHYKKEKKMKQTAWQSNGKIKFNYQVIGNRKYGLTG